MAAGNSLFRGSRSTGTQESPRQQNERWQFVLAAALKRQTRSKINSHLINELRRLGVLQKHLFQESNGALSKEYANVLVEITEAIKRIGC
ncbi:plasmid mobilization protein MobA [Pseudomonas poae]|uniref:plasmid mobilization protein MobA n=1 Tax=Pseudomonas poae TaxID=200451 RepID=UPI0022A89284|nr:plasmid mobilization protein MobA [Pseudomonas poae]